MPVPSEVKSAVKPSSEDGVLPAVGHLTWTVIDQLDRTNVQLVGGDGLYLDYSDGTRIMDASGGAVVVGIGHGREDVARVAYEQMKQVAYGYDSMATKNLFSRLKRFTPGDLNRFYPCGGGGDAVEAAIRFARHYHRSTDNPGKHKVISRWMAYHGNTLGAASLTGQVGRRHALDPMLVPFPKIEPVYPYRRPEGMSLEAYGEWCADRLEDCILREGPEWVSAFIVEPLSGSSLGCVVPPPNYLPRIHEICDKYDVLMIADEVMTGFGRTGRNFAIEHFGVVPDIIVAAKGLTSGYVPMGVVAISERLVAPAEPRVASFGSTVTYSYHPVSCAVADKVLSILEEEKLVARAAEMGEVLAAELARLADHPLVGDIRGLGLFHALELVRDKATKEPFELEDEMTKRMILECRSRGVSLYSGVGCADGKRGDLLMVSPPFIVTHEQIREIVDVLEDSLDACMAP